MNYEQGLQPDTINRRNEFEQRLTYNNNYTPEEQRNIKDSLRNLWVNRTELGTGIYEDEKQYNRIIEIFDNIYTGFVTPIILRGSLLDMNGNHFHIDMKLHPSTDGMMNKSRLFHSFILGIPSKKLVKPKQEQIPNYSGLPEGPYELYRGETSDSTRKYAFKDECNCLRGVAILSHLGSGGTTSAFKGIYEDKECVIKFTEYMAEYQINEFKNIVNVTKLAESENFIPKIYNACICRNRETNMPMGIIITEKLKYTREELMVNYLADTIMPIIMDLTREINREEVLQIFTKLNNWWKLTQKKIIENLQILVNKYNIRCSDVLYNTGNTMVTVDIDTGLQNPDFIVYIIDFGWCGINENSTNSDSKYDMPPPFLHNPIKRTYNIDSILPKYNYFNNNYFKYFAAWKKNTKSNIEFTDTFYNPYESRLHTVNDIISEILE